VRCVRREAVVEDARFGVGFTAASMRGWLRRRELLLLSSVNAGGDGRLLVEDLPVDAAWTTPLSFWMGCRRGGEVVSVSVST